MNKRILNYSDFIDEKKLSDISLKLKDRVLFPEKIENAKKFMENVIFVDKYLPTYEDCLEMCSREESPFYEQKHTLEGFNVSIFNYRLAQYNDFVNPLPNKPNINAYEMRGLTFVFNTDGTLYKRFLLLEKFFNINQVPESMYSIIKDYKIKFVNDKEDGSIATFIKLPNGSILGKSKMGFDNDQAIGITSIYKSNPDIRNFVEWCLNNDIVPIFEYVAPTNRVVLKYSKEELILLRMRNNNTGKHINIKDHFDKLGSIKISPFKDDFKSLDSLMELTATEVDKEGYVIQAEDKNGRDFFFKLKTPWYCDRHSIYTTDIYKENILIKLILDDKIDDVLGQIPEDDPARERINKIISIIKKTISDESDAIDRLYKIYIEMNDKKSFALKYHKNKDFPFVMSLVRAEEMKKMTTEEILNKYENIEQFEKSLNRLDKFNLIKEWIKNNTKRLVMARDWLKERDPDMSFRNPIEDEDDN